MPISDMQQAIEWYSRLLGLPSGGTSHEGRIYNVPMQGEVGVILDSHKPVTSNSVQPLFFLMTDDIQKTYRFLQENGVAIVSEIENIGSVSTLMFKDPDNNLLMVVQANR